MNDLDRQAHDPVWAARRLRAVLQRLLTSRAATPTATTDAAIRYHRARIDLALRTRRSRSSVCEAAASDSPL